MGKIFAILMLAALFFSGCEEKKEPAALDLGDSMPSDVPIAQSDANVSIDENMPPEPVPEK